jgi:hypothetical protein
MSSTNTGECGVMLIVHHIGVRVSPVLEPGI